MATTINFTCTECLDDFSEPVQAFIDAPGEEVAAPVLCRECGHGDDVEAR